MSKKKRKQPERELEVIMENIPDELSGADENRITRCVLSILIQHIKKKGQADASQNKPP